MRDIEVIRALRDMTLRTLRPYLIALLCCAGVGLAAGPATAATYHDYLCRVPYGPAAGTSVVTDPLVATLRGASPTTTQNCNQPGGSLKVTMPGNAVAVDGASLSFQVPSGLTLPAFTLWRYSTVGGPGTNAEPETQVRTNGAVIPATRCAVDLGCAASLGDPNSPLAAANKLEFPDQTGVTLVSWIARCSAPGEPNAIPAGAACPSTAAVFQVFAADMVLDDPTPPAVTGAAGPLLAGGTLVGAQTVSVSATDAGSGVSQGSLVVDGAPVVVGTLDTNGGACADLRVAPDGRPSYVHAQPCPATASGVLTLNTDALTPGAHTLTVLVSDAAGNQTVASTATVTVVGAVPVGTPNGNGASRDAKLTARWTSTKKSSRRLGFKTGPTITGRLVGPSGTAIGGAAIEVLGREHRSGAPTTRIAGTLTGADGTFRVKLPGGPSRTITVQYTAFSGDGAPAAKVRLSTRVGARVSASITPRSVRIGQLLRVRGRLRYLRRARVDVAIQARDGRVWRTVDVVKTRADGRFSWPYRFRSRGSAGRTYAFRARVNSPIYPFAPGNSAAVIVRVRR
jgi:hypothetical protein